MHVVRFPLLAALMLLLCSCISAPKTQLKSYASKEWDAQKKLDVEFVPQKKNLCGPSVIKMAAEVYSPPQPLTSYQKITFRENVQGTFKSDILSAARRLDLVPYKVDTIKELIAEVHAGHPVVVFQNLGLAWMPQWHFALVVGYDLEKNILYLHSGTNAYEEWKIDHFVYSWQGGGSWAYILLPPTQLPKNVAFDEALDNAMLFEKIKKPHIAKTIFKTMTQKFPDRYEPHLGLANLYYNEQNRSLAIVQSQEALNKNPSEPALLFNLAILYHEDGQYEKAYEMKDLALVATPEELKLMYLEKLSF